MSKKFKLFPKFWTPRKKLWTSKIFRNILNLKNKNGQTKFEFVWKFWTWKIKIVNLKKKKTILQKLFCNLKKKFDKKHSCFSDPTKNRTLPNRTFPPNRTFTSKSDFHFKSDFPYKSDFQHSDFQHSDFGLKELRFGL